MHIDNIEVHDFLHRLYNRCSIYWYYIGTIIDVISLNIALIIENVLGW